MNEKVKKDPGVIHIKINVVKKADGSFEDHFDPKVIRVTESDTILNFRLTNKTPDDIRIRSVTIRPEEQDQLSAPSISKNGKQVTLSDVNTIGEKFHLKFYYEDKDGTRATYAARSGGDCPMEEDQYPEVDNVPLLKSY